MTAGDETWDGSAGDLVRAMEAAARLPAAWSGLDVVEARDGVRVTWRGGRVTLRPGDPSMSPGLDLVAAALRDACRSLRADAMLFAAGLDRSGTPPPWLIATTEFLADTVHRAGCIAAVTAGLEHDRLPGRAPVAGEVATTCGAALLRGRVRAGLLSARFTLSSDVVAVVAADRSSRLLLPTTALPETVLSAIAEPDEAPGSNIAGMALDELVDHPLLRGCVATVRSGRSEGAGCVVLLRDRPSALAPAPRAATAILPRDADPARPCEPTAGETAAMDDLRARGLRTFS